MNIVASIVDGRKTQNMFNRSRRGLCVDITYMLQNYEPPNFYAVGEISPEDICIEVDEVGKLYFPLLQSCIEKLIGISSKAQYVSKKQSLQCENIFKIASDKLHVSINQDALNCLINNMKKSLNFDAESACTPILQNLLICCPGDRHYLNIHEDSKESENKIATLIIVLPVPHIGGDMLICNKKTYAFSSQNIESKTVKCVGFHAERQHVVKKVREGYRIALTYNLTLKQENVLLFTKVNAVLSNAVNVFFQSKNCYTDLVLILSHRYTEDNLRWHKLEKEDRSLSSLICSAAKELNLIFHLVMVNIRQKYPENSFLDESVIIKFWVDSNNKILPLSNHRVSAEEVCYSKFKRYYIPYKRRHDDPGFTGNMYWQRRAAIVLWHESRKDFMSFLLDYENTLHKLYELTRSKGHQKQVMELIKNAGESIYNKNSNDKKSDFQKLAEVALYIEDNDIAFSILSRFQWSALSPDIAISLVKFESHYSTQWCINLLEVMAENSHSPALEKIDALIQSYMQSGGDSKIVHLLIEEQYHAIIRQTLSDSSQNAVESSSTLAKRLEIFQETLNACLICMDHSKMTQIIHHAVASTELYPLASLVDSFLKCADTSKPEDMLHHQELKNCLMKTIDHMVMSKMQQKRDWSITVLLPCRCRHCKIATDFLFSSRERKKVWSIGKFTRAHVERIFHKCGVPVKFSNLRRSFVMVKTKELHRNISEELKELKFFQRSLRALNV